MSELLLKLENVSYESQTMAPLHNVSFSLMPGENAVLFGPENSGIETLFMIILDLDETFDGTISYKGLSIKDLDYIGKHNYKKEIGYVHGLHGLISNMTVEDNISLPLEYHSTMSEKEIKQYVNRLIYDLNLDYCKKFRPVDLSNSEILRTSYARAVALDPDFLLVEHAFGGQSPLNIQSFMLNLKERTMNPDKSVVMITYNPMKFIDFSDRFLMFFGGRIVFEGNREEFISSGNPYLLQFKEESITGPMAIL